MIQAFEAVLLAPLSYRTRADTGAGGASVTGYFLGDIAMNYAIHYARYGGEDLWDGRTETTPRYADDHKRMNHRCSVAIPIGATRTLPIEYQSTSFVSEGYPLVGQLKASASSSMKNWMQKQSLAPFNRFVFAAVSKDERRLPSEFTVRLGNGRETLVHLKESSTVPEFVTLNAFTLSRVLNRPIPSSLAVQMESERYILLHGVETSKCMELLGW